MHRKEIGSDFHYPIDPQWCVNDSKDSFFSNMPIGLYFSGRAALYHLLHDGIENENWNSVYLPSYYCHEVTNFISTLPIHVQFYDFNPFLESNLDFELVPDTPNSVLVTVSFFGMPVTDTSLYKETIILEDLSHSLSQIKANQAHYCFGSLRKELPLPAGGFCYSPKGLKLPEAEDTLQAVAVSLQKEEAMLLKGSYLTGVMDNKEEFRKIFSQTEANFEDVEMIAALPENALIRLRELNVATILDRKATNLAFCIQELKAILGKRLIQNNGSYPTFGLVLQCSNRLERDALKVHLINSQIYPVILWPEQKNQQDRVIENCMLFIHTDFRYTQKDILKIIETLKSFFSRE